MAVAAAATIAASAGHNGASRSFGEKGSAIAGGAV
jgi:hypothetical protein